MPRRGNVPKREVLPDPIYNSVLVTKLINSVMLDGKKGVAQKVVYDAFHIVEEKTAKRRCGSGSDRTCSKRLSGSCADWNSLEFLWRGFRE